MYLWLICYHSNQARAIVIHQLMVQRIRSGGNTAFLHSVTRIYLIAAVCLAGTRMMVVVLPVLER